MSDTETTDRIRAVMQRHNLDKSQLATYLGVPPTTIVNWLSPAGSKNYRKPNAAVERLVHVLGIVEVLAPAIHESLLPRRE